MKESTCRNRYRRRKKRNPTLRIPVAKENPDKLLGKKKANGSRAENGTGGTEFGEYPVHLRKKVVKMKKISSKQTIAVLIVLAGVVAVGIVRSSPAAGEWYARHLYPPIASGLSWFSSRLPFSLGDCWIVAATAGLLVYIGYAISRRKPFFSTALHILLFLGGVYVWFYFAWGLNYFREDFYTRAGLAHRPYEEAEFRKFLDEYVTALNEAYVPVQRIDTLAVQAEVKAGYERIAGEFGMIAPGGIGKAKPMLWSGLMSKTGVLGYMEPFFAEFCLNRELLPVQYPQTYAHELSHRLSIASEAEANLYAYLVCTASSEPAVRFSGYFSLFPYVMRNAAGVLPEAEYRELLERVRPEVIGLYRDKQAYWEARYGKWLGEIQYRFYNFFLKGNRVQSGTANYSEVIGLLMACRGAGRC